ncbi:hypothetical protein [Choristoneura occidentalis alphabaculovirus]|nr:hypothetical protein [Choristoneura occidentalis alphabaculovirus]
MFGNSHYPISCAACNTSTRTLGLYVLETHYYFSLNVVYHLVYQFWRLDTTDASQGEAAYLTTCN